MAAIGRPPGCTCDECPKCKHKIYMREWYRRNKERGREIARESRARNLEKVQARDRNRLNKKERVAAAREYARLHPEIIAQGNKTYRERYPEKRRAHIAAGNAIRDGRLVPQPCVMCGEEDKPHAHHDDYSKPLEVRWLCQACHIAYHVALREIARYR